MDINITNKTGRNKLKARREPYWHLLADKRHIGVRKGANADFWIARVNLNNTVKKTQSLGQITEEFDFEQASKAAWDFFANVAGTVTVGTGPNTVQTAIDAYVKVRKKESKESNVNITISQLGANVPQSLRDTPLSKLSANQLSEWKLSLVPDGLDFEAKRKRMNSANQVINRFKAALNYAYSINLVGNKKAWEGLKKFDKLEGKFVDSGRKNWLTTEQVLKLLAKAEGDFKDIFEVVALTGCRPGEIYNAKVKDFRKDGKSKRMVLDVDGKTSDRPIFLSAEATAAIKRITKDKMPNAYICTRNGEQWNPDSRSNEIRKEMHRLGMPETENLYSLRHYYISTAVNYMPVALVAKNCGTSVRMIEKTYLHGSEENIGKFVDLMPTLQEANA